MRLLSDSDFEFSFGLCFDPVPGAGVAVGYADLFVRAAGAGG